MELIDLALVDRVLALLAVASPLLGLIVAGIAVGAKRARWFPYGVAVGAVGPLLWVLWRVMNGIQNRLGLDSVAAVGINAVIFIAVGLTVGLILGKRCHAG